MRLHRRAGAARASEGHSGCTSADVSVCASYALGPSHIAFCFCVFLNFFSYQGKVLSLVRRDAML